MTFESITNYKQHTLVEYWKSHNLSIKDFYCRECGKFMLDLENLKDASYLPTAKKLQQKFRGYVESEQNRWLVKGRYLSGKVYFRHICWDCFFKHLPEIENISKRALKSSWYKDVKNGIYRPPAPWTSPSKYFKLLFDITDEELSVEHKKFDTASLESFIRRHGETEGRMRFDKYKERQAYTCSKEYMMNEHGMSEDEWNIFNASRAVTLENLVTKHGKEVGEKMWKDYCDRQAYAGCKLEYFIEKYGYEQGREEYRRINRMKEQNIENFIRKYGEELGSKKWRELLKNREKLYSKISQRLFTQIDDRDYNSRMKSIYAPKSGKEFSVETTVDGIKRIFHLDYVLGNKAIEFYGDYFHANPREYVKSDPIFDVTAEKIWERDKKRIQAIKDVGYDVKIVWEYDYNHNKDAVLNECLAFINGV